MTRREHPGFTYQVFQHLEEIPGEDREVLEQAVEAREKAYAPYSEFLVGASIRLKNGRIIAANNQENAAYPSGMCAERTAIYMAGATYPSEKIEMIAISSRSKNHPTTAPNASCGACRQAMLEYELNQESPIRIYFFGEQGEIWCVNSLRDLIPLFFDSKAL